MFKKVNLHPYALRAFVSFNLFLVVSSANAEIQSTDSIRQQKLNEVTVNAKYLSTTRTALPVQIITENELGKINANNISDIAKHFAGVTVKDYGGIGGLKTVSIRGLGAMHTGIAYDGTIMSDVQSGQIDLSQFSIENIAEVSLNNGQPNDLLQSARMFASAGVLSFVSKTPEFVPGHTLSGKATAKTGSFGMFNPTLYIDKCFSDKFGINLSINGLKANGEYPFTSNLNRTGENLTVKNRINSDVTSLRTELNTIYRFSQKQFISVKANQYYSERGLPGADSYYISYSTDRIMDKNLLTQIRYENKSSIRFQYFIAGKFNQTEMIYSEINPNYSSIENNKRIDNYKLHEYYLTSSVLYRPLNNITISSSIDWWYNDLFSGSNLSFRQDAAPTRNSGLANIAAKYTDNKMSVGANLLYTICKETNQTGLASPDKEKFSPTFFVSIKPINDKNLRIRAFYKNIFRLPTFTELYYHDFGYTNLRPENASQFNLGITYSSSDFKWLDAVEFTADAYYNKITDKISIMYGMPFSSVRNIGEVNIKGCDLNIRIIKNLTKNSNFFINANYTYTLAQDVDKESDNYKDIIPYTPVHSGSGVFTYQYKNIECGYNFCFAGKRYSGQNSNSENVLKPYIDHNIFGKIKIKKLALKAELINLSNQNYEIIKFYPMPGRNFRFTASYTF